MRRTIEGSLISLMLVCLSIIGSHAQAAPRDIAAETAEWQNVFLQANESAVLENGKLQSLRLKLPKDRERYLTFEHAVDGRSFTIVEDGRRIVVVLDDQSRISTIIFPNGKKALFEWKQQPNGYWVAASIKVDGRDFSRTDRLTEADCSGVCENAAVAATIAIGVCLSTGPLSVACFSSTASAAYATYLCYRCANPDIECPPEN